MIRLLRVITVALFAACVPLAIFAEQDVHLSLGLFFFATCGALILGIRARIRRDRRRERAGRAP